MRPVGADGELHLEEELVRGDVLGIARAAVLPAKLAELARPERQEKRSAFVGERRIERALRIIEPGASEPAAGELVFPADVPSE